MNDALGNDSTTATWYPSIVSHCQVILEKVFKMLSDFYLADFALKWTMHIHKIHLSVSAVKALVW